MVSAISTTMTKMIETLPEELQEQVLDHMRDYIEDIREEIKWRESFSKSQSKLITAAQQARKEISEGKAIPLDLETL